MIRFKFETFKGTFVFGISFSVYENIYNKRQANLIFDLGKFALAFIFGKDKKA